MDIVPTTTKTDKPENMTFMLTGRMGSGKTHSIRTLPHDPKDVLIINSDYGTNTLSDKDYQQLKTSMSHPLNGTKSEYEHEDPSERKYGINQILSALEESKVKCKVLVFDAITTFARHLEAAMKASGQYTARDGGTDFRMYGEYGESIMEIANRIKSLPSISIKILLAGAVPDTKSPTGELKVDMAGQVKDRIPFCIDEVYYLSTEIGSDGDISHRFQTQTDGIVPARSRLAAREDCVVDRYEPAHFGKLFSKIFGKEKK